MIHLKNLSYRYNRKKVLFNGLNLDMQAGKIYGLLGKNGAGKSTLMKMITGLLFPFGGACVVNGFQPRKREVPFLEQLFFIPEELFLPNLSVGEFIKVYAPFYPAFNGREFALYLKEFGVDEAGHLQKLSFGQKKKTFIAFGLATNTRLLVMDEPTNGLDIPSKVQFRKIMMQASQAGKLILLSTHQVRDLDDLISTVIIMDDSRVLLHEEKERIGEALCFRANLGNGDPGEVLYEEETPNGRIAMFKNDHNATSYIDLEILFNATLSNPILINAVINQNKNN